MYLTKKIKILQPSSYLDNIYKSKQANVIALHTIFFILGFKEIQYWSSLLSSAKC